MDDPTKNQQVSSSAPVSSSPPAVDDTVQEGQVIEQPISPPITHPIPTPESVGGMNKEMGPMGSVEAPLSEVLQPSEQAPVLEQEVEKAGVEVSKNPDVPDLTMHDRNAGISHAPVIAPIPTEPSGVVDIQITKEQALEQVKANKNPKNSKSWLVIEFLKMAQRKLMGGHD
ncbi:MAG: hypothetical protein KBD46_00010 [Candidatus Levybacteria bacterium]|nr:hypothetical protein [Candidatus Levybacteria bacterium]